MKKEKQRLPLIYHWIRGAIGKEFVIKQYRYGPVKTRYPDMTRIIASESQRKCRNLFKEAVSYAKEVMRDPVRRGEWEKRVRNKRLIWPKIIRFYMLEVKRQKAEAKQRIVRMIRKCFNTNYRRRELSGTQIIDRNNELNEIQKDHHLLKRDQLYYCK